VDDAARLLKEVTAAEAAAILDRQLSLMLPG
jgi:hypothetical protein